MRVAIIAEHAAGQLASATASAVTAGLQLANQVEVWVLGYDCDAVAEAAARLTGVAQVRYLAAPALATPLAEHSVAALQTLAVEVDALLAGSTTFAKDLLPRLAGVLQVPPISEVIEILDANRFVRVMYAGHVLQTVRSDAAQHLLSVRCTAFKPALPRPDDAALAPIDKVDVAPKDQRVRLVEAIAGNTTGRPALTEAEVVISGGRGLQNADGFARLAPLAEHLSAAIGATRAAVDAGFVSNDHQVGQTGKVVAPKLYLALGISGAIQHIAGMKDSDCIVAINQDADAPIFQVADVGLVGDVFAVLTELEACLGVHKASA